MTFDLIIIGAGPAGLSAALYGRRAGINLLVIERSMMSGGQITDTYEVDNYPGIPGISGFDLAVKFREHVDKLSAEFAQEEVLSVKQDTDSGLFAVECKKQNYTSKAVLIATGAHHSFLGVPGEKEFAGRGVSYCATCDGAFFRGKNAVVVGGGDVALEDAVFLSRICARVYLIHRRELFRAADILVKAAKERDNIEMVMDTVVTDIEGEDTVSLVRIKQVKTGEIKTLETSGVFIAVGTVPETEKFDMPEKDEKGYIKAGEDTATSVAGIFAAGDVRTKKLRQVITAAADGANAITEIGRFLSERKGELSGR